MSSFGTLTGERSLCRERQVSTSESRATPRIRHFAPASYKVNQKAELEIRHLHEKMDSMLKQQAQRIFDLQDIQIELMEWLAGRNRTKGPQSV